MKSLFYLFSTLASVSLLVGVEFPAATNNPAVVKGGLVFGVTDEFTSKASFSEALKDWHLVSTNVCNYVIYNRGSTNEPLMVPRRPLSPFKIELKDSRGRVVRMTPLGREASKAPKITKPSTWRSALPWRSGTSWRSVLTSWATEADKGHANEFPDINQYFQIETPGDYVATVRVRYWVITNTAWFEKLSEPAIFIWHVPATNAPPKK